MYLELLYKIIIFYDIRYLDNLALRIKIPVRCIFHIVYYTLKWILSFSLRSRSLWSFTKGPSFPMAYSEAISHDSLTLREIDYKCFY